MEFSSISGTLPHIPDDLTIPQFILDSRHPNRPLNEQGNPWFIEESTGRRIGFEEVRPTTYCPELQSGDRSSVGPSSYVRFGKRVER